MIEDVVKSDLGYVMSLLKLELKSKLEAQGHGKRSSSKLIDTMDFEIVTSANVIVASMYMQDYYIFVEKGVKNKKIPYGGGKSKGGTSKYIQALIKFWKFRRGLSEKNAKSAAFATANKHKKEGMPTKSSFKYSKDGTRLGFIEDTLDKYQSKVIEILERRVGNSIELFITNALNEVFKGIKN